MTIRTRLIGTGMGPPTVFNAAKVVWYSCMPRECCGRNKIEPKPFANYYKLQPLPPAWEGGEGRNLCILHVPTQIQSLSRHDDTCLEPYYEKLTPLERPPRPQTLHQRASLESFTNEPPQVPRPANSTPSRNSVSNLENYSSDDDNPDSEHQTVVVSVQIQPRKLSISATTESTITHDTDSLKSQKAGLLPPLRNQSPLQMKPFPEGEPCENPSGTEAEGKPNPDPKRSPVSDPIRAITPKSSRSPFPLRLKRVRWNLTRKKKTAATPPPAEEKAKTEPEINPANGTVGSKTENAKLGVNSQKLNKPEEDTIEKLSEVPSHKSGAIGVGENGPETELISNGNGNRNGKRVKSARSTFGEVWNISRSLARIAQTAMFFIHGVGGSSDIWSNQIEFFSNKGYEIIAVDLVGHGRSPASVKMAYRFEVQCSDMLLIFDLYSKQHNIVVAHSYGSCLAAVLARERRSKLSHLVLISSGAPVPLSVDSTAMCWLIPTYLATCIRPFINAIFLRRAFFRPPTEPQFRAAFGCTTRALKYTMLGQIWPEGNFAYHRAIDVPTLLIYGSQDQFVSLQEMMDMQRAIAQSRLEVVDDGSHLIMLDQPNQVSNLVDDFIQAIPACDWMSLSPQHDSQPITGDPLYTRKNSIRPNTAASTKTLPRLSLI